MSHRIAPPPAGPLPKAGKRKLPSSALSGTPGQRRPRRRQGGYLDKLRKLPCLICGQKAEAAHIRYADDAYDKRETGIAEKPDDKWALPLSPHWHTRGRLAQHRHGERQWWQWVGIDPLEVCEALWAVRHDFEAMEEVAEMYRLRSLPEGTPSMTLIQLNDAERAMFKAFCEQESAQAETLLEQMEKLPGGPIEALKKKMTSISAAYAIVAMQLEPGEKMTLRGDES